MCIFIFTHINEAARGIGQCLGAIAKDLPRLAESCGKDLVSCTRRHSPRNSSTGDTEAHTLPRYSCSTSKCSPRPKSYAPPP